MGETMTGRLVPSAERATLRPAVQEEREPDCSADTEPPPAEVCAMPSPLAYDEPLGLSERHADPAVAIPDGAA